MSEKVDPKEIQKKMPKTWPELEKMHKQVAELQDKTNKAKTFDEMPGMHPIIRAMLNFLIEFKYVKGAEAEVEYFKKEIVKELEGAKKQQEAKLSQEKFQQMYMEEVQKKAAKPIPNKT